MWKLGNLDIDGKVVLAPMAGITSSGYREFFKQFGAAISVSEMVSDMGLIYGNQETKTYVDFAPQKYTGVQLFGYEPENIKKAAEITLKLNKNIDFFDINMGCPVPKVTKTGAGSSLLKDPKRCGDIVRAIKSICDLPVTAKIRLGWDEHSINFMDVISELEDAGVDAIAIHARTKKELYSGTPHYELLKGLQTKMKVPLIVSGNIFTLDDAINAIDITGATAVMVARGAIGNPYLVKQIDTYYRTGERLPDPSCLDQIKWCLELCDFFIKEKGEETALRIYRGIASKFFSGFANSKHYRKRLSMELTDRQSLVNILDDIKEELKE